MRHLISHLALALTLIGPPAHATQERALASDPPHGSGSLDAIAPDGSRLGGCPLEHTRVHGDISGFVARVRVVWKRPVPFCG